MMTNEDLLEIAYELFVANDETLDSIANSLTDDEFEIVAAFMEEIAQKWRAQNG